MMEPDKLAEIASRYALAVADSTEGSAPLYALLYGESVLALNSIARTLATMAGENVGTPDPEPVNNSNPEPEPTRTNALWRGRNGKAVDTETDEL